MCALFFAACRCAVSEYLKRVGKICIYIYIIPAGSKSEKFRGVSTFQGACLDLGISLHFPTSGRVLGCFAFESKIVAESRNWTRNIPLSVMSLYDFSGFAFFFPVFFRFFVSFL